MDEAMKRAVEAGAGVLDERLRNGGFVSSQAAAEAVIRAALPVIGEGVFGAIMKRAWEIDADAATADAMVRAGRSRLAEMEG